MPNIEKILWDDAGNFGDADETWMTKQVILENYHKANFSVTSIGHIVYEDNDSVIIATSHEKEYEQYALPLRIPKLMIKERILLNV